MSSDPIELNQGENEEQAAAQVENNTSQTDSTGEVSQTEPEAQEPEIADAIEPSAEGAEAAPEVSDDTSEMQSEAEAPQATAEEATDASVTATPIEANESAPAESPATEEEQAPSESDEAPAAEAIEASTDEPAEPVATDSEEAEEELEAIEVGENFSEEAMLQQIDQILANETNLDQLIESANPNELIFMLDHFYKAEEIQSYIRRVGLIKRAFDGIRDKGDVPKELLGRFSTALARFNKKRSEYQAAQDQLKEANSQKKRDLLVKLKEIVDSEDVNKIAEVREIQETWKAVGHVKRDDMEELYREFRFLLDTFYKNRELHFQLRDYDRQINLEAKERLLEELKTIIPEEEERSDREIWNSKNDLLTDIQTRWRAVGHVPREDMERINDSYREITGQFFAIRREFFESQDEAKKENEDKKRELLAKMQAFETFESNKPRAWNEATEQLRVLQEAWKEIGPAPKEVNSELWKAYRNVGNTFFTNKSNFFKQLDESRNENLKKKRELCEKAEAINESTEFEKTAREMRSLQEEWKSIGPVPERYSNKLWARFRAACDVFFQARRQHYAALRSDEEANLERKRELIGEVKKISVEEAGSADAAIEQIKDLQARWKAIGRVPYKDKDVIWKEFRAEIDQFFDDLRGNRDRTNYARIKEKVESLPEDKRTRALKGRIQKMRRRMDAIRQKVEQYSTNILFISKGKSGDSLRAQIQKEIDKENRALEDMRKQLKQLNEMLKNPPKEEEETPAPKAEAQTEATPSTETDTAETPAAEADTAEAPAAEAEAPTEAAEASTEAETASEGEESSPEEASTDEAKSEE